MGIFFPTYGPHKQLNSRLLERGAVSLKKKGREILSGSDKAKHFFFWKNTSTRYCSWLILLSFGCFFHQQNAASSESNVGTVLGTHIGSRTNGNTYKYVKWQRFLFNNLPKYIAWQLHYFWLLITFFRFCNLGITIFFYKLPTGAPSHYNLHHSLYNLIHCFGKSQWHTR